MTMLIESNFPYVKFNKGISTNYPVTFNGAINLNGAIAINNVFTFGTITQGTVGSIGTTTGTVTFTPTSTVTTLTPTGAMTINFASPALFTGVFINLEVVTSGSSSFTLTFGTNTKNQGTLATGTASGKVFLVCFVSDGTNWIEVSRTTAM